jgi:hypothetical protein
MKCIQYIRVALTAVLLSLTLFSCVKDGTGPSVEDNILNYEIEEIPVTTNYTVGALYNSFGTFNANVKEVPVAGKYNMPNGIIAPAVMTQHIDGAGKAGLDYFLFSFRSASRDLNNYRFDSAVVKSFLDVNGAANMKFALVYNFQAATYGLSTTAPLENDAVKLEQFFQDFQRVGYLYSNANYMKVNGKILLYIRNAHQLFSNNNPAIYATLRNRLNTMGFQAYIVGFQEQWSPPARYPFRFKDCVDAITHESYSKVTQWDWYYLLPQTMDQNWLYSKKWFADHVGVDYVPNISPAFNPRVANPANTGPVYGRADNGTLYKKICNVAKKNASAATRLILIDSWNDWINDTQMEPAVSYGESYLTLTKSQFKK